VGAERLEPMPTTNHKGYTLEAVECTQGWMVWFAKPGTPRIRMRTTRVHADLVRAEQEAINLIDLMTSTDAGQ
jgi:hypothetical protein